ncbi:hypothetical protein [Photobacterium ganghwense]|uniref:hypothetical protein n=1 Tax=Photobacterium ganghwense TaxID=320778 RepID=UPI0039F0AFF2
MRLPELADFLIRRCRIRADWCWLGTVEFNIVESVYSQGLDTKNSEANAIKFNVTNPCRTHDATSNGKMVVAYGKLASGKNRVIQHANTKVGQR